MSKFSSLTIKPSVVTLEAPKPAEAPKVEVKVYIDNEKVIFPWHPKKTSLMRLTPTVISNFRLLDKALNEIESADHSLSPGYTADLMEKFSSLSVRKITQFLPSREKCYKVCKFNLNIPIISLGATPFGTPDSAAAHIPPSLPDSSTSNAPKSPDAKASKSRNYKKKRRKSRKIQSKPRVSRAPNTKTLNLSNFRILHLGHFMRKRCKIKKSQSDNRASKAPDNNISIATQSKKKKRKLKKSQPNPYSIVQLSTSQPISKEDTPKSCTKVIIDHVIHLRNKYDESTGGELTIPSRLISDYETNVLKQNKKGRFEDEISRIIHFNPPSEKGKKYYISELGITVGLKKTTENQFLVTSWSACETTTPSPTSSLEGIITSPIESVGTERTSEPSGFTLENTQEDIDDKIAKLPLKNLQKDARETIDEILVNPKVNGYGRNSDSTKKLSTSGNLSIWEKRFSRYHRVFYIIDDKTGTIRIVQVGGHTTIKK